LNEDGQIVANGAVEKQLATYQPGQWHDVSLILDVAAGKFDLAIDGKAVIANGDFAEYVKSVERISFRTGSSRTEPTLRSVTADTPDVVEPDPDVAVPVAVFRG
jgi:hypothetical protein